MLPPKIVLQQTGLGKIYGNWINNDMQYAVEWPEFERNLEQAHTSCRSSAMRL